MEKILYRFTTVIKQQSFQTRISTLMAQYKGNFSYKVSMIDNGGASKLLKLPNLHMYDYFAEINFILSNPQVGDTRNIKVFDLDFENEVFMVQT